MGVGRRAPARPGAALKRARVPRLRVVGVSVVDDDHPRVEVRLAHRHHQAPALISMGSRYWLSVSAETRSSTMSFVLSRCVAQRDSGEDPVEAVPGAQVHRLPGQRPTAHARLRQPEAGSSAHRPAAHGAPAAARRRSTAPPRKAWPPAAARTPRRVAPGHSPAARPEARPEAPGHAAGPTRASEPTADRITARPDRGEACHIGADHRSPPPLMRARQSGPWVLACPPLLR